MLLTSFNKPLVSSFAGAWYTLSAHETKAWLTIRHIAPPHRAARIESICIFVAQRDRPWNLWPQDTTAP